jgi:pyruvate/2-oxoacid:ferredoxin oxidoreductase alpha subunit
VIENYKVAKAWFTPQQLFMEKQVENRQQEAETLAHEALKEKHHEFREEAKANRILLGEAQRKVWKFHSRNHDERQPYIRDQIIEAI